MTVISYPIPAFQNVPIQEQFYRPKQFIISNIALGTTTTITTSTNQDYYIGQEIRLIIPPSYGCIQLNQIKGFIISIPSSNQVIVNIDSSQNVDPFIAASLPNKPQIIPIGDINSGAINNSGLRNQKTFIDGSFINISPN